MKRIASVFVLVVISLSVMSQVNKGVEGVRFGMQLTPTVSWFTSDEPSLVDPDGAAMGYSFGIVGDYFFKPNYAFSTGIFMDALGGKLFYSDDMAVLAKNGTNGSLDVDGVATLRPSYLEVPVGFKFLTKEFWRTRFVGQCGLNQYLLLNAKLSQEGEFDNKDISDEFSRFMSAYHFGFGAEYALGGAAYLTGSIMATIGINDVTKSESSNVDPTNKLNVINFKLGVIF